MKKCLSVLLTLIMLVSVSACGNGSKGSGKTLYEQGFDVASLMVEATRTEKYVEIYSSSSELGKIIKEIGEGDYETLEAVYAITIDDEKFREILEVDNYNEISERLQAALRNRMFGSLITQINGMGGTEELAVSSICTHGKTFVDDSITDNTIYLYVYEDALPIAVTFTVGEGGAVSASGTFIMYDGFSCGSVEEVEESFRAFNVEVSEIDYSSVYEAK